MQRPKEHEKIVSIIIPVFNNEKTLPIVFTEAEKLKLILLDSFDCGLEVIYVDDGSTDNSRELLKSLVNQDENARLLINQKNIGAIKTTYRGIKASSGDCVLSMAADLQDPFSTVISLVKVWRNGADFCAARRKSRDDPPFMRLQSYLFYLVLKIFVFDDFPLEGFDICLIDRGLVKRILSGPKNIAFGINAYWQGYRPEYVYYNRLKRAVGRSSWKISRRISYAIDILLVCSNLLGKLCLFVGLISSVICAIVSAYIVLYSLLKGYPIQGWASIMVSLSVLASIIIFYLSLVIAYLSRIYSHLIIEKIQEENG